MRLDARKLKEGTRLGGDVCVVGAGPAGISVALGLAQCGATVLILESGGIGSELPIQELNDGPVIGDSYAGLRATRHRGLGGTALVWNTEVNGGMGAKYVPLDPEDFEPSGDLSPRGWPLDYATLEPYYRRAHRLCGLGPFTYAASDWESRGRTAWPLLHSSLLTSSVYQFGPGRLFTTEYIGAMRNSGTIQLCDHLTVVTLHGGPASRVMEAQARVTTTGATLRVHAKLFVLAAGAVENARLLLVSANAGGISLAEGGKWVGRCFMEHPRDTALVLSPRSRDSIREAGFYDAHVASGAAMICGRVALREQVTRTRNLPNLSITLLPWMAPPGRMRRALRRLGLWRERRGHGWSQHSDPANLFDRFQLLINLEQRPSPENRISLACERDALGVPRAQLHWRWSDAEQAQLETARSLIAADIESAGVGRIERREALRPDPNAHHHAGTTRMAEEGRWGVVDTDGRVLGTDNLYVAGTSVFPTAGFANPTLTIVALAVRLAEHLRSRI